MEIILTVNKQSRKVEVRPAETLLDLLRRLGYKSVKYGCGEGACGACTVIMDGRPVNSCLILAVTVDGREVTTVEDLGTIQKPHLLQSAFVESGAVQCGFCTPGMIMAAKALLDRNPSPSEDEIKEALDGNLCRCTGYVQIIEAVRLAARRMKAEKKKN
ncbi:MAG: (2Fe-2S)-binding protein [Candidatus Euphemobacter frigidus]|nr:(2Fe-2S)-binding protein [Candidatus Euphemobacter frigidus]MDP8276394.1 (2Fe-2S)-binding protein [Candidatus Euphemobacter frigidus]